MSSDCEPRYETEIGVDKSVGGVGLSWDWGVGFCWGFGVIMMALGDI